MGTDKHSAVVQVIPCGKDTVSADNTLCWGGSFPPWGLTHPQRGGGSASTSITLRFQLHS